MDWVAVGLCADLRNSMAMPSRIAGTDLAIWRSVAGRVHAWGDRCPHRGMRLSQGFVRGETLSCIYHGWQYGEDGGCTYIPAHPKLVPPKSICATTYPCQEADGVVWVSLLSETDAPLPSLDNKIPVRSISIEASVDAVGAYFGNTTAMIFTVKQEHSMTFVLQPTDTAQCVAHVLVENQQDVIATSRWLEAQRNLIEGVSA